MKPDMEKVLDRLEDCVPLLCEALDAAEPDEVVDYLTGQILVAVSGLSFWRWEIELHEEVKPNQ